MRLDDFNVASIKTANVIIHMHVRLMHTGRATTKARLKKCAMLIHQWNVNVRRRKQFS